MLEGGCPSKGATGPFAEEFVAKMILELITETICRMRLAVSGNVFNGEGHRADCLYGSSLDVLEVQRGQFQVR